MSIPGFKNLTVLICGDRHYTDYDNIVQTIQLLLLQTKSPLFRWFGFSYPRIKIVEGECRGADQLAAQAARQLNLPVEAYPVPDEYYTKYKRGGPLKRNQDMLDYGRPNLVLAFHHNLAVSRGTKDMVRRALQQKLPVILVWGQILQGEWQYLSRLD